MERLKVLGTWIILVIAFFIFSSVIIKINLNQMKNSNTNTNKHQVVNESNRTDS